MMHGTCAALIKGFETSRLGSFKFLLGKLQHVGIDLQERQRIEYTKIQIKVYQTACTGFQMAKKLAASNLALQAFEGFIGT